MPDLIPQSDNDPDDYDIAGLTRTPHLEESDPSVAEADGILGGALDGHPRLARPLPLERFGERLRLWGRERLRQRRIGPVVKRLAANWKTGMKHQFGPAVVTSVGVLLCFFAVAFAAKLSVFYWLGAILVVLPLFFRILWLRCATECGPAKKDGIDVQQPKSEDVRKERDHMETVLNNRVNFLVAASAIIGAAATLPKGPKDQATVFMLGACIAALSLVGIDRSCTKLNYYLSWLNRQKDEVIRIFDDDGDLAKGLPGSVYACTYGIAYFILVIFAALSITVSLGVNPT